MSRSYLFIPGNTPSMVQTMDVFESDAVIFDLEDSVMQHEKVEARELVISFLESFSFEDLKLYIRINVNESHVVKEDILKTSHLPITGYVIPNATTSIINEAIQWSKDLDLIPIIEDPMSVLRAEELAKIKQVKALLLGAEDLTKAMGIARSLSGNEIDYARKHIAMVAHAYTIDAIDTPYTNTLDEAGLKKDAQYAKELGFMAKACIHPNHVATINTIFSPTKEEIKQAKRIVTLANKTKKGAFSLDGEMIDAPIIKKAELLLKQANRYNLG